MKKNSLLILFFTGMMICGFSGQAQNFVHPGGLVTQADVDRIQYLKDVEKDATIVAAFNKLQANSYAKSTYNPNPQERVSRGDATLGDNYSKAMYDAAAAYQNALMWRITNNTAHAECAVRILNGWARTCKRITGDTNASLASGLYGYEFAQAGELLRGYEGWAAADFKAFQKWMRDLWYPRNMYFLVGRHGRTCSTGEGGHYMSNWGLCNVLSIMSIGILCDDVALYNQGLHYYKDDICGNFTDEPRTTIYDNGNNEFLGNLVVWLHPDSRGPYGYLGQMQESGRDQGHATMAAGLAVDICQTAWSQGDDLYGYMNNRIAAGFEYIALVNSLDTDEQVADSVPFHRYSREGLATEGYVMNSNGLGSRGAIRPCWDRIVAHYEGVKGVKMRYSEKMRDKTGIDGGGGNYGSNSGGFDHLGFSTITNYIPPTWYPAANYKPVPLTASIIYNGTTTYDNRQNGVTRGSSITLSPVLPEDVTGGTWKWETGEITRELTFNVQNSGIYRVTYTAENGAKTTQAFNIAVWGDCTPDVISYKMTLGETSYVDTMLTVLPYQKFSMSISTAMLSRGSAVWNTGATGFNLTVTNGVRNDSVFWVEHTNEGGYKTRYNFHIDLMYATPSVSIDGGNAVTTNLATVTAGQSVELKPVTTTGYENGTFRWETGHKSKSLFVLNVQKPQKLQITYTLTKNDVTTVDTLNFNISVIKNNYQLANGDYYFQDAATGLYLTNPNANATDKAKPVFDEKNETDTQSQLWTITKETDSNAGGRFKIVSKKDGNYINENCDFGANQYYPAWNTYTLHCLDGENLFAIQNGGSSGTKYWIISGNTVTGKGADTQNGYPFLITPAVPQTIDNTPIEGANIVSYIAPAYSINGGASQRGSNISLTPGKNLLLKPVKVTGLTGGAWLWNDGTTAASLDLENVQISGVYSTIFTYPEEDTTFVCPLAYTVVFAEDNYTMPAGDYRILRAADNWYFTNDGTLNPLFVNALSADSASQIWTVSIDETTSRHKIVSQKDGRFVEEHGRFNNSPFDAAWNTYLLHYRDEGERLFAIQNAGSAGSTYWAVEGNMINDRNHNTHEGYPFKFEWVNPTTTGIQQVQITNYELQAGDKVAVYDIAGRSIMQFDAAVQTHISNLQLPHGVYIVAVNRKGEVQRFKIFKN